MSIAIRNPHLALDLPMKPSEAKLKAEIRSKVIRRLRDSGLPFNQEEKRPKAAVSVPRISHRLLRWFTWYARRYLRRYFHTLPLARAGSVPKTDMPLEIYSNHPPVVGRTSAAVRAAGGRAAACGAKVVRRFDCRKDQVELFVVNRRGAVLVHASGPADLEKLRRVNQATEHALTAPGPTSRSTGKSDGG